MHEINEGGGAGMKRLKKVFGMLIACMLVFTVAAGPVQAAVYDSTWTMGEPASETDDPFLMSLLYPGDSIANTQITLGDDPVEPEYPADGQTIWTNRSGRVYQILVQNEAQQVQAYDEATGEPLLDEFGNPVMTDLGEAVYRYRLDAVGGVIGVVDGSLEADTYSDRYSLPADTLYSVLDESGSPVLDENSSPVQIPSQNISVASYPAAYVTVKAADKTPEGKKFQKWSVYKMEDDRLTMVSDDAVSSMAPGLSLTTDPLDPAGTVTYSLTGTDYPVVLMPVYEAAVVDEIPAEDIPQGSDTPASDVQQIDPAALLPYGETGLLYDPVSDTVYDPVTLQPVPDPLNAGSAADEFTDTTDPADLSGSNPSPDAPSGSDTPPDSLNNMDNGDTTDPGAQNSILNNPDTSAIRILNTDSNLDTQEGQNQPAQEEQNQPTQEGQNQPAPEEQLPDTYVLSLSYATSDPAETGKLEAGTPVSVTANDRSQEGYVFDRWTCSSTGFSLTEEQVTNPSVQIEMPAEDVSLTAEYQKVYALSLTNASSDAADPNTLTAGTTVNVMADEPAENQEFTGWEASGIDLGEQNANPSIQIQMPEGDVSLTALYMDKIPTETITAVNATIEGADTVDNGDGSSSATVQDGTTVTVTANPAPEDKKFEKWEVTSQGDVETSSITDPTLEVKLSAADVTVEPVYAAAQAAPDISKEVIPDGAGTISDPVTGENGLRTFILTPNPGYQIKSFTATSSNASTSNSSAIKANSVNLSEDKKTLSFGIQDTDPKDTITVRAELEKITYTLTVNSGNADKATGLTEGEKTKITAAAPQAGYRFTQWTLNTGEGTGTIESATSSSTTFTMAAANATVTANYEKIPYTLTVNSGSGAGTHYLGDAVVITADPPQAGYRFRNWTITGGSGTIASDTSAQTTFTMAASDAVLTANYELIPYTLTVKNGSGSGSYTMGTTTNITPNYPSSGKEFDHWEKTSGNVSINNTNQYYASVTMKASDATITAFYKDGPNPNNNTITGLENGAEYLKSSTLTFTAGGAGMDNKNPNPGDYRYRPASYQIGSVGGSWSAQPYTTSMAINAVGDYTLTVTYGKDVYDGNDWVSDGTTVTRSITFHIVNALSVKTGDNSPLIPLAIAGGAALVVIIILIIVLKKRRKGR